MGVPYTNIDTIRMRLFPGGAFPDADAQTVLTAIIDEASRAIDAWCKRPDGAFAGQTQLRTYDVPVSLQGPIYYTRDATLQQMQKEGNWPSTLISVVDIDPLLDCTALRIDQDADGTFETLLQFGVDYDLAPTNARFDNRPYSRVRILPNGRFQLPIGINAMQIEGIFGQQVTVPPVIKQATELLVMRWYKRPLDALGTKSTSFGGAAALHPDLLPDPDVTALLLSAGYVKSWLFA